MRFHAFEGCCVLYRGRKLRPANSIKEDAHMCNGNFGNNWWWIIILLLIGENGGCGCNNDRFDGCGNNAAWWIIILALLGVFGGCGCGENNGGCGCGC